MITPESVEPFDEGAQKSIGMWEAKIDKALQKEKGWVHEYTHANNPERFADIARRYHDAGWNVVVAVSAIEGGHSYKITIRHPAWALPADVLQSPQAPARR